MTSDASKPVPKVVSDAWPTSDAVFRLSPPSHEQIEFLMREHENLSAAILANEASGETRVNVFVGLIAAATAGLGVGARTFESEPAQLGVAVIGVAIGLLAFGLATLRRVMQRNIATTEFINGLRVIRAAEILANRSAVDLFPVVPRPDPEIRQKKDWWWGSAGYAEIVLLANTCLVVVATIVSGLLLALDLRLLGPLAIAAAVVMWIGQVAWTKRVYERETLERADRRAKGIEWWHDDATDAGETFRAGVGMVVARRDGSILALERADIADAWQLPQGGIDRGEDAEAAAWRELEEEVGLTKEHVTLVASSDAWYGYELPIEHRRHKTGRGQVHRWFLFRVRDGVVPPTLPTGKDAEFRAERWVRRGELVGTAVEFRQAEYREVLEWIESQLDRLEM